MDTNFWWFKVDATGVKEPSLIQLSASILEQSLAEYVVNPDNRDNLENIPNAIKNIEKKTKNNIPGSDDWNEEKFNKFKEYLETAFNNILNSEIRDLVNKHINKDEKLVTGMKVSSETDKLKDLLDSQHARDFMGATLSLDKDISATQKELLNRERHYSKKEFFVGHTMTVKKERDIVKVVINVNHVNGKLTKKLFKAAFPKSSFDVIEVTPVGGDPSKRPKSHSSSLYETEAALKRGDWGSLSPDKTVAKYLHLLTNPSEAKKGDKARINQLGEWYKTQPMHLWTPDKRKKLLSKHILYLIEKDRKSKEPSEQLLLPRFNIKLDKSEVIILNGALKSIESKLDEKEFKKFVKKIIDNGKLYKQLRAAHSLDFSVNDMNEYFITLNFNNNQRAKKDGTYTLDSHVKQQKNQTVNLSALMTGKGTTKLTKPYISKPGPKEESRALVTSFESGGFNKARSYFVKQIKSNINNIKKAASKLGVTLEA